MNNSSQQSLQMQQLTIPVNTIPTHIVVWQDSSAKGSVSSYLEQKVEELSKTVNQLMERIVRMEVEKNSSSMEPLSLPPNKSSLQYHPSPTLSAIKTPIAPRSPFFPSMVSPEPVGMSIRPRETVAQMFSSLIKPVSVTLPDVKYNLNEYSESNSEAEVEEETEHVKVNVVKVEEVQSIPVEKIHEEIPIVPQVVKAELAVAEQEEEEEVIEEEEEEEEVVEEVEEEKRGEVEVIEEEVVEEEEVEEEEEAVELTEFEYKGKTYYRDQDNQVYIQDEDGDLDDTPIGVWNPEKNKILKYQ